MHDDDHAKWARQLLGSVHADTAKVGTMRPGTIGLTGPMRVEWLSSNPEDVVTFVERFTASRPDNLSKLRNSGAAERHLFVWGGVFPEDRASLRSLQLFDTATGFYWAGDAFAAMVPGAVDDSCDVDADMWEATFLDLNRMVSPWHAVADQGRWDSAVDAVAGLPSAASPRPMGNHCAAPPSSMDSPCFAPCRQCRRRSCRGSRCSTNCLLRQCRAAPEAPPA